jgi:hypothetical protein
MVRIHFPPAESHLRTWLSGPHPVAARGLGSLRATSDVMVTTGGKIVTMDMRPAIATHNRCSAQLASNA